ncbi:MAG: RNA polymerase sigma factor [Myxococcales bacterium]|nr:RNA polymerase sigma factor [Myxococcales bacterium]
MREETDETLMLRYRDGDIRAFEQLLLRHRRAVYLFILRFVGMGNAALAEDLTQETFLRVVKHARSYEQQARFVTWLYTMARNLCVDALRRAKHRQAQSLDAPMHQQERGALLDRIADGSPALDRRVITQELQQRLQQAIASLPEDQREVFLMREVANLQFKDIAAIIGISENTVKSRMRYALEKLREALDDYEDLARAVP